MEARARTELILSGVGMSAKIVEIGPSYNPLVPKRDGWNSYSVDHNTRAGLAELYRNHPVDVDAIEEVDFVWTSGLLVDAVPDEHHGTFDFFIASHVIEHSTDIIGFINSAERLLKQDGKILLAIPDKRACFDYFRRISSTSEAVRAHLDGRSRHRWETFFDCDAYTVFKSGHPGWFRDNMEPVKFDRSICDALDAAKRSDNPSYINAHAWVFTPASFSVMMLELWAMGFVKSQVMRYYESDDTEFFTWMEYSDINTTTLETINSKRIDLLNRTLLDFENQAIQVTGNNQALLKEKIALLEAENKKTKDLFSSLQSLYFEELKQRM